MNDYLVLAVLLMLALCTQVQAAGNSPNKSEIAQRDKWVKEYFTSPFPENTANAPFSFQYGDKSSKTLLSNWDFKQDIKKLDKNRTQTTQTYTDPQTGLQVSCDIVSYSDYPTVEWTLHFKNTGKADTPILSNILAIDTSISREADGEFVMHRIKGDSCTPDSYQPLEETLSPGFKAKIAPNGGRPTNGEFPYFNISYPGGGWIAVISWAGQWSAEFARDNGRKLHIASGQELTHFKLHPGEEARSPMVVIQFYDGDVYRAQNIWRHWMMAHNTPKAVGKTVNLFLGTCVCGMFPGLKSSEKDAEQFVDRYIAEGFHPEWLDTDAGWYPCDEVWSKVGTWEPDPVRYPNGLRELSDYLHKHNIRHYVWFEPERVSGDTWLTKNHPEWVHGGANGGLLRLDDPECLKWVTDRVDSLITSEHIDLYRQDFNIDPLPFWREGEPEDRQGITENHHVINYFAFWDELLRRHPGMLIDCCASGGRRNDLETLRRAVPLLRSDYQFEPIGNQAQTHGLASWFVYWGTGNYQDTVYVHHSSLAPFYCMAADIRKEDLDWSILRKLSTQYHEIKNLFLGDYYPLTPWSLDKKDWIGFQFDKPEDGKGFVQAFRRPENKSDSITLKLHGLDPKSTYDLKDLSSDWKGEFTGRELTENGLKINVFECPGDALIVYTKRS